MDWLRMSSRRHKGWTVVEVSGELDVATRNQLGDHLEEVIAAHTPARVVLDMSQLDFCDASGLSVLVAAHHAAKDVRASFAWYARSGASGASCRSRS
ncbi:STAS domain-containing protein [Streptomyces sp. NPDC059753]|uniref:STAS domain-containing protein n=1 Tax=Streptomyces sp. NPDC059753 TaxID=3346933 RepID=UPI0036638FA3